MTIELTDAAVATGRGWSALITPRFMYFYVDPDDDDALEAAVAATIAPARQPFFTVEWSHEDDCGWDVYYVALAMEDCYVKAHQLVV